MYLIYHYLFLIYHLTQLLIIYQFIYQFGIFAGVEIKNIPQRIQEMKDRGKPYKYIERMLIMLKKKINVID